jgi:hypothetical protein
MTDYGLNNDKRIRADQVNKAIINMQRVGIVEE